MASLSETELSRLNDAWEGVTTQYLKKAVKVSMQEGPGISLFRFLNHLRKGIFNCDYFYASKSELSWEKIISWSPYGKDIETMYDSDKHFIICVQIPTDENDDTIGNIKIFEYDTMKEIDIEV